MKPKRLFDRENLCVAEEPTEYKKKAGKTEESA
jgi:hypothetical protein